MKQFILAAALLLTAATAVTAQTPDRAIVVSAEQVQQIAAGVRSAQAAATPVQPNMNRPIISAQAYTLRLEHRIGKAAASIHPADAELMIVLDGAGTLTTGGTLVKSASGANDGGPATDIAGGALHHVAKGDMMLVPQGTPHMLVPDAGGPLILATLYLPRAAEPAPVAGRAPSAPKLFNKAADLPGMIAGAKVAMAASPRWFGGDTLLQLAPYRVGLEYRSPKGVASVHKNDGEFMWVLEGEGSLITGGTVINGKDVGANIDGDAIAGGIDNRMKKGDFIFVPKGVPHLARTDGVFVLATLHVVGP